MVNNEVLIFLIVVLIAVSLWLFTKLKVEKKKQDKIIKDYVKLMADNAFLEAEQLKFQLQPHTLNNILANLKVFASKLNKGMDSLSETLDYILYSGKTHFVSVKDEMNFIKKYLALNDLFINEIDAITFTSSQINEQSVYYKNACIPHLITAYFIENAFKHGDIHHPQFLNIQVKLSGKTFEMHVKNRIKKKPVTLNGGLGLSNMKKRLDLLQTGNFIIQTNYTDQEFHSSLIINFV